jgi:hypothetical protein
MFAFHEIIKKAFIETRFSKDWLGFKKQIGLIILK